MNSGDREPLEMDRNWRSLDDVYLAGKRVLTRVDYNVPLQDGRVTDDTRITRSLPTLAAIHAKGGIPILISHLGRPKSASDTQFSLAALAPLVERLAGAPVKFCSPTVGPEAETITRDAAPGTIVLMENLRFDPREKGNDPGFAASLARLGDIYCNDAFSASHRAHASIDGIARLLPSCAGQLMEAELNALSSAFNKPKRPLLAVIGGAKISTKIPLIHNLLKETDCLFVGGAMANTFLLAQGLRTGASLVEPEMAPTAKRILETADESGCELVLPVDAVAAARLEAGTPCRTVQVSACPDDMMMLDIGPQSIARVKNLLLQSQTLIWNGPPGAFEHPPFDAATRHLARVAAELTLSGRLLSYAGGGDTTAALNTAGVLGQFTYVSSAGGAFLAWIEGRRLPGVAALAD